MKCRVCNTEMPYNGGCVIKCPSCRTEYTFSVDGYKKELVELYSRVQLFRNGATAELIEKAAKELADVGQSSFTSSRDIFIKYYYEYADIINSVIKRNNNFTKNDEQQMLKLLNRILDLTYLEIQEMTKLQD